MTADFVHLHNHSEFSLLDGLSKVKKMVARAKELNMKALAITDHGSMYGTIYFYKACLEAGIKPIIGCEIYITAGSRFEKGEKGYNHLILLAENNIGYKNLMKIVSKAHLEGYYYKPRTDLDLLREHHEGIICLSACVNGFVSEPLLDGQQQEAEKRAKALSDIFGKDHFYLELQQHIHVPPQEKLNPLLIAMSKKLGIPLTATNDNHYTNANDAEAQEILLCIQTQTTIDTPNRKLSMIDSPDFYMKSQDEMESLFAQTPEAVTNTGKIADMCQVDITLGKWVMPKYEIPEGTTLDEYLEKHVFEGAKKRYGDVTEEIKERIAYELSVIFKKGYSTYFLTVADFVNWAKDHGISVGPGRGSAAGSVVSYCLNITDIDPFFFKLPFERFLNPQRPSAPDIDLDFADTRREEVIQYVTQKYGADKVAQIITFGTMEAKGSVRDVGRALGMPYAGPDRISKMIPLGWQGHAMTLDTALEQSPDLKRAYNSEEETRRLIDLAKNIEGVVRHASVHAAGVVIADKPLTEYVPIQREPNGGEKIVTQYDMYTVGEDGVGLLKMDFLGLRNLTIIEEALKFIKQTRNIDINISTVPLDDERTYNLLASGETTGIFQLESAGMRRYIKDLKPTAIYDLMAMVALYRPGPMANIPEFIARKHNPKLIAFPDPRLTDALQQSYGMLVYQDDVLLTTIQLAGYTWLDADKFRKAMGKKIPSEMKKQKEKFLTGAVENGLSQKRADEIYELIAPFAGYGFNKAHAACYATIAYRTAYLKANYSVEFMTALLTAESRGTTGPTKAEKISQAVAECKRLSITVLPPDINASEAEFSIEENSKIRFGLSAIKNVGGAAITTILGARSNGPFLSLDDFCKRVDLGAVNKKTLESLIKAGAMDRFGNRAMLLASQIDVAEKIAKTKKQQSEGQDSLFGDMDETITMKESIDYSDIDDFSHNEKLAFEKEFLGFYLTAHPQAKYLETIKKVITHDLDLLPEENGVIVKIGGIVEQVKRIFTRKSNAEMAFVAIANEKGTVIECVVFPKVFDMYREILLPDTVLLFEGKLDSKDDRPVLIVNSISKPQVV
ncbi:MAG TPA: DNA polymerase III subunit alpha [Patescibacteria group bacterium]|nr:DNA polymerase III subunit alpha [Patescibacteria group bacterium]